MKVEPAALVVMQPRGRFVIESYQSWADALAATRESNREASRVFFIL
jgi:hypothetical protein